MPAGTIVTSGSLVSPGGQQGIPGPNAISSDAGNAATWGSDGRLYVAAVPTGTVLDFGGFQAPLGFLFVDGSAQSRTQYPNLFNALTIQTTGNTTSGSAIISAMGTTTNMQVGDPISGPGIPAGATVSTVDSASQIHISANATATASGVAIVDAPWGVGDGVTTFNLPDPRGRASIGRGQGTYSGATNRQLADNGGEETHALAIAELASHTHTQNAHNHTDSGHAHTAVGVNHSHAILQTGLAVSAGGTNVFWYGSGATGYTQNTVPGNAATTTNSAVIANTTATNQNTGSGTAHNNMQPYIAFTKIIKT